jgi:cell division protein FtsI (penicillin-binding protein 3)
MHGASGGTVIVMDVKTGAVRAMASFPDFDPNDYSDVEPEVYNTNPAVGQVYEPGSTFKILTVAAGMQANAFDENSQVLDEGTIRRYDYNLSNYDFNGNGLVSPGGVLYYSSNIGALLFAEQMGESVFYKAVEDFGFGKATGIELPGETAGIYWKPGSANYTPINLNTNSYGQGIAVTPLQIARMTAAVGNNGVMMQPYIVQKRCNRDGTCVDTEPVVQSQPISAQVALKVRGMLMRSANHYVNARQPDVRWLVPGFRVGAKTGTSSIPDGYGGYTGQTIGSVAGMAPLEAPRYAVLVKIDRPIDDIYGIATALPVYRRIVAELMRYDRIAPNYALMGDGQRPGVVYGD